MHGGRAQYFQSSAAELSSTQAQLHVVGESVEVKIGEATERIGVPGQKLLAFLAVNGGATTRARLATAMWPDLPTHRGLANVRAALWRLRGVRDHLLQCDALSVSIAPSVLVDLWECERLMDEGNGLCGSPPPAGVPIASTANRDLLTDWDEPWLNEHQQRFHLRRLSYLEDLGRRLLEFGRGQEAVRISLIILAADPLREVAHELMIRSHLADGNRGLALTQFNRCADELNRTLGVAPSSKLQALVSHL